MRVLILGLGQYPQGSGISAALFFARQGEDVRVTDQKTEHDLAANVKKLKRFKNVSFVFGKHRREDIRWADVIIRNPRVRPSSPEMRLAAKLGTRVESDVSLFMERCPCPIVAITGTRGKSTTATLVAEMLTKSKKRTWLGGNIRVSPLTFLSRVTKSDIVVLELSSWQLETTGALGLSPAYALVTNIMRDHLNTYDGMDDYAEAKAQIFRHQWPNDVLVLNADDAYGRRWMKEAPGKVLTFGKKDNTAPKPRDLRLIGEHNVMNVHAASILARAAGATPAAIRYVATHFKGIPDRLEQIATVRGIRMVNDTTSTTPDATIAAIRALAPSAKRLHLLAGGADKKLEFDAVAREIKRHKVCVSLFEGTAHTAFSAALKKNKVPFETVSSMKEAVAFHRAHAAAGDVIVLSPGSASFGMFTNEFDRGEQFKTLIKRLK